MVEFFAERRRRIESLPEPDHHAETGAGLRIPLELAAANDAFMFEMQRQASDALARGEATVQVRLPLSPATVSLVRWGDERQEIFDALTSKMLRAESGPMELFKLFVAAAVRQVDELEGR